MSTLTLENEAMNMSKTKNASLWVVQIAVAGMFLMAGSSKLAGAEQMVQLYNAIGVGQWFRYVTGAIEVTSALLLFVPALAGVAGLLLAGTMAGAILTHLFVIGGNPSLPIALLVGALFIAWGRKDRTLALMSK